MKTFLKIFILIFIVSCQSENQSSNELKVLKNSDSDEITFILELNTKENPKEDVENFTQYLSDFIVEREPLQQFTGITFLKMEKK